MREIRRHIIYSIVIGLFLSLTGYFGFKFANATFNYEGVEYSSLDIVFIITLTVFLSVAIYLLLNLKIIFKEDKHFTLRRWHIFLPLILMSIVLLITLFPGFFPWDSVDMYKRSQTGAYTNHFSPLITFLIGATISFGKAIGHPNIGHALLIIAQFVLVNIALTETIFYCSKKLNRKVFGIIMTVFFVFHPLVQILSLRSGQDTIFAGFFLLLCLEFLKISENSEYFNKKLKYFYIFVLVFFTCATRNNGLYAILPTIVAGIFILKKEAIKKKFLFTVSISLIIFFGYNHLIINNIVPEKDSFFRETINVPVMQIARTAYFDPDNETIKELKTYFDSNCINWRDMKFSLMYYIRAAGISDPYKDCMLTNKIDKDPLKFFRLWAKAGAEHPVNYVEAPAVFMLGLYYPFLPYEPYGKKLFYQWHLYIDSYTSDYYEDGVNSRSFTFDMKNFADFMFYQQEWSKIPVLNQLWRAPITTYLCFFAIVFALFKRKYKYILPLALIFGLWLTVFLSPVLLFRYLLPVVLCTPIMVYILIKTIQK